MKEFMTEIGYDPKQEAGDRPKRCRECDWVVRFFNGYQCLNRNCSLRNKKECERLDYYEKHKQWPMEGKK